VFNEKHMRERKREQKKKWREKDDKEIERDGERRKICKIERGVREV
jgi:hypothetical protein